MTYTYTTAGTCSRQITFELEDGILRNVVFIGGCHGNLQGIGRLVEGMEAQEVIRRLKGINCREKGTSCPDQLSRALSQALSSLESQVADSGELDR